MIIMNFYIYLFIIELTYLQDIQNVYNKYAWWMIISLQNTVNGWIF